MMQSQATSISNQIAISKRIGNTKLRFQQTQTISNDGWLLWRCKEISVELPEIVAPKTCLNPIWGLVDHWLLVLHGTRSWTIARNQGLVEDFPQLHHAESVLWRLTPGKRIMGYHRIICKTENWLYIKVLSSLSSHFNFLVYWYWQASEICLPSNIWSTKMVPSECSSHWSASQLGLTIGLLSKRGAGELSWPPGSLLSNQYFMNRFPLKRSSDKIYIKI